MKSIMIKSFIGLALANFTIHMAGVAHLRASGVWDLIVISFITWGAMAMVFSICNLYKLHKEAKETEAKYREAMEEWEALVKRITAK